MKKILAASCALALMGSMTSVRAALIDTDFTAYADYAAALADGWSQTTRNGRTDNLSITANGLESVGWKQSTFNKALAGTVDLSSDNTYTINYRQLTSAADSAAMFALTSAGSSLVIGQSYSSDPGLYIGDEATDVLTSSTWYTFQTGSGNGEIGIDSTASAAYLGDIWKNFELVIAASSTGNDTITLNVTTDGGTTGDLVDGHVYSFASSDVYDGAGFMLESGGTTAFSSLSVIPEPATFGMIVVFGGVMLFVRRKLMM